MRGSGCKMRARTLSRALPHAYHTDTVFSGIRQLAGDLANATDGTLRNFHVNVRYVGCQLFDNAFHVGGVRNVRQHFQLFKFDVAWVRNSAEERLVFVNCG